MNDAQEEGRMTPEDGHTMLMLELIEGQKTFKDYTNLISCLEALDDLYNQNRALEGLDKDNYDMAQLFSWIDEFHRIELLIYDKDIARYKRVAKDDLKRLIEDQVTKTVEESGPMDAKINSLSNGNGRPSRRHRLDADIDEDDEEEEDWDSS